jgi:UDP-N-acetylmuramoyl-L-alanyl-D-glutamate--2,6-diaminopimelate ligase
MMAAQHIEPGISLRSLLLEITQVDINVDVSMLTLDARDITIGGLFLAVSGTQRHGMQYAEQAVQNGAAAIVFDPKFGGDLLSKRFANRDDVVMLELSDLSKYVSEIASRFYRYPSKKIPVIGITGTNGKTSISHFIAQAMGTRQTCAVIGTLGWGFLDHLAKTVNTTPDAVSIQRSLSGLLDEKAEVIAMEVSSHGLQQNRVAAVEFDGAVFTNLTHDHLDYHGSMEAYGEAKLKLFQSPALKFAVVNLDDSYSSTILKTVASDVKLFGYSRLPTTEKKVDVLLRITNEVVKVGGLSFSLDYQGRQYDVRTELVGSFNIDNITATLAALLAQDWEMREAINAVANLKNAPGRMERILLDESLPLVVVDFAHTPDALASVLESVREHCDGKLIVVFGCGGDRDSSKRELMGQVASTLADSVIVTNDNPRHESPERIAEAIMLGVRDDAEAEVLLDREAAIYKAVSDASVNDVVVVAGKGHEDYQIMADERMSFSDIDVVHSALHYRLAGGAQ